MHDRNRRRKIGIYWVDLCWAKVDGGPNGEPGRTPDWEAKPIEVGSWKPVCMDIVVTSNGCASLTAAYSL